MIARLQAGLLDLFFPCRCLGCGREGSWACPTCQDRAVSTSQMEVLAWPDASPVVSLLDFRTGLVRELLHTLKYNGIATAAACLGELARRSADPVRLRALLGESAVLLPVPTSPIKRRQRGYNQAEEIARVLSVWLGLPVWTGALRRKGGRESQVGKGAVARQAVRGAFAWVGERERSAWASCRWILVDDLMTTGSTLQACLEVVSPHAQQRVGILAMASERQQC